jgi:hypothetical protein
LPSRATRKAAPDDQGKSFLSAFICEICGSSAFSRMKAAQYQAKAVMTRLKLDEAALMTRKAFLAACRA